MLTQTQTTLTDLHDKSKELKQYKADYTEPARSFTFTDEGTLTVKPNDGQLFAFSMAPVKLTDWAMKQAFGKLGKAYGLKNLGTDHMQALAEVEPDLFAMNMNRAIARLPENECWTLRTYKETGRAVLSDQYLKIDNDQMIAWLNEILKSADLPHRLSRHSFVNVDNMNIDVLFGDIRTGEGNGNGEWTRAIRIRNGEIGDWQGGVFSCVKRTSCDNSIAVDRDGFSYKFRHAGNKTFEMKKVMLRTAMLEILPLSTAIIEKQLKAEEVELPNFSEVVGGLAIKHGWSEDFKGAVHAGSEARYSVAGLVNGITFAAHAQPTSPEQQVDMEFLGGKILFDDSFSLVDEAAHVYNSKEARKAYAEANKK